MIECQGCEYYYYNEDDNVCMAFECNGIDCPELPCETANSLEF